MTQRTTRLSARRILAVTAVALVVALGVPAGPATLAQASAQSTGLEVLGELEFLCPDDREPGESPVAISSIDVEARRLYTRQQCDGRIVVFDLSTEIPTPIQTAPEPDSEGSFNWKQSNTIYSTGLGRAYLLGKVSPSDHAVIEVLDLATLEGTDTWDMREKIPGFVPMGFVDDPARERLYVVGKFDGVGTVQSLGKILVNELLPTAAIVAIDAGTGEPIWVNPLRNCDTPVYSTTEGGFFAMSDRGMLYTFCQAGQAANQPVGQNALVRLDVSEQGDASGVVDLPSDFFPVSGDFGGFGTSGGGVVALDPVRERVFAHSLSSRTHGAWVFDGLRSSWIGFVAARDNSNRWVGVDPATGKHYMAGGRHNEENGYVNVTDGGATPVPQGRLFTDIRSPSPWARDLPGSLPIQGNLFVDSPTGRLFTIYNSNGTRGALVLRDTTPPITPRTPLDLDELTHDLPDDDDARLEFSANTSGFGAQYINVGGWENLYTRPAVPIFGLSLSGFNENPANIRYGNRGATMSLVERIGIASSGSSATAIATQPDDNTPGDAQTKQNQAEQELRDAEEELPGDQELPDQHDAEDAVDGEETDADEDEADPTRRVTCLDGAGDAIEDEAPPGGDETSSAYAYVRCDLENFETTARARFSGGSGGGGLVVSRSSFDGRTYRDPERGTVSEATAVAEGISFGEVDVGGMSIDRVTTTVTTQANGLEGTARVRWVRKVQGARTFDADGTASEPSSCTTTIESGKEVVQEGECEKLKTNLNEVMPNRFEVKFPLPEIEATPKGAFASVQENETDFLSGQATNNDERRMVPGMELIVFADGPQRGRLWVQLAAVKADSTFIRSPIFESADFGGPQTTELATGEPSTDEPTAPAEEPSGGDTVAIPVPDDGDGPPPPADEPEVYTPVSHQEKFVGAFGWLPALRSAGDAALTGALYVLFLLPAAEVVRRRRLLDVLNDAPAGEATRSPAKPPVPLSVSPVRSTS